MANLIKIAFSIGILIFILTKFNAQSVWEILLSANPLYIAGAIVFQLLSQLVAAYRWSLIMGIMSFKHSFMFYLKSYFKGSMFNQVLPTSIGGDALRVAELKMNGNQLTESFYGVFIDRIAGLIGLLLINLFANQFDPDLLPEQVYYSINIILIGALFGLFVLMAIHKFEIFNRYKITRLFYDLSDRFRLIYKTPKRISQQVGLSILIHLFAMVAIFGLGHSVGINEPLIVYLVLVPPAILLTVLPISFAGWGVREGALVALFLLIGINENQVLAMSILYGLVLIISALPGLVFYLRSKHKYV